MMVCCLVVFSIILSIIRVTSTSEWNQYLKDSHLNNFINSEFSTNEWKVNMTGQIWGYPILDSDRNTFVFLLFDSSTFKDVVVEIDVDSGKIITFQEVREYKGSTQRNDEGYGGFLSKSGYFLWMYGDKVENELKAYNMKKKKVMEGWKIGNVSVESQKMFYVLKENRVIYLEPPFICDYPKSICNVMVSKNFGSTNSKSDWKSKNIRCDSHVCYITLSSDGNIYVMNDIITYNKVGATTETTNPVGYYENNNITVIDSSTGNFISIVQLDPSVTGLSKHISVANKGPSQYYFLSVNSVNLFKDTVTVYAYNADTNKLAWKFPLPGVYDDDYYGKRTPVVVSPDGQSVGVVFPNDTKSYVYILDAETGNPEVSQDIDFQRCTNLMIMKNGNLLLLCSEYLTVVVMDPQAKNVIAKDREIGSSLYISGLPLHDASGNVYWCWNEYDTPNLRTVTMCKKKNMWS